MAYFVVRIDGQVVRRLNINLSINDTICVIMHVSCSIGKTFNNFKAWVTDFKYLGYCISEFKSDVEDKLQTYNKINGAIRRHFGKQMNKETKLRIHNITAKAALKFRSEAWVLKKREEQRLEAAQMKFLRHLLGITKLDLKNQCVREKPEQRI